MKWTSNTLIHNFCETTPQKHNFLINQRPKILCTGVLHPKYWFEVTHWLLFVVGRLCKNCNCAIFSGSWDHKREHWAFVFSCKWSALKIYNFLFWGLVFNTEYRQLFSSFCQSVGQENRWQKMYSPQAISEIWGENEIWTAAHAIWIENHSGTTFWMQMRWCRLERIFPFPTNKKLLNLSEKRRKVGCLSCLSIGFFIKSGEDQILV